MNNSKIILFSLGGIVLIGLVIWMAFVFFVDKKSNETVSYPRSVQSAINSPIEKIQNWSTLVKNDNFEISHSSGPEGDSFFITINAQPVLQTSQLAEQALLQKLGVKKEYACTLPLIMTVPANVDPSLAGNTFGMSFCPDQSHISDANKK